MPRPIHGYRPPQVADWQPPTPSADSNEPLLVDFYHDAFRSVAALDAPAAGRRGVNLGATAQALLDLGLSGVTRLSPSVGLNVTWPDGSTLLFIRRRGLKSGDVTFQWIAGGGVALSEAMREVLYRSPKSGTRQLEAGHPGESPEVLFYRGYLMGETLGEDPAFRDARVEGLPPVPLVQAQLMTELAQVVDVRLTLLSELRDELYGKDWKRVTAELGAELYDWRGSAPDWIRNANIDLMPLVYALLLQLREGAEVQHDLAPYTRRSGRTEDAQLTHSNLMTVQVRAGVEGSPLDDALFGFLSRRGLVQDVHDLSVATAVETPLLRLRPQAMAQLRAKAAEVPVDPQHPGQLNAEGVSTALTLGGQPVSLGLGTPDLLPVPAPLQRAGWGYREPIVFGDKHISALGMDLYALREAILRTTG